MKAAWAALRSGSWMTRERATGYLVVLILANVFGFTYAVCHAHGFFMEKEAHFSTEFMGFYAAGKLIDQGTPGLVYDPGMPAQAYVESLHMAPAHDAMQRALAGDPKLVLFASFYPPVFWLVCAPLARLSYYVAFLLWTGASLAFFLFALRSLVGSWKALWPVPAYLSFYACAGVGENSFLSAGLLTFGLVKLEKRPV
ncbi:MAG TPA: glycosyltransferase 87 family protein, partial [Polyangiaceae bacterium]